jgi:predicted ArsR family transcriptional regulator
MTPKRGRPLGVKSFAVLRLVAEQPMPVATLASTLQLSYRDTVRTVDRLASRGVVSYGEAQRHTGGRPARVVRVCEPAAPDATFDNVCKLWRIW